jgi:hypothetical protein
VHAHRPLEHPSPPPRVTVHNSDVPGTTAMYAPSGPVGSVIV